MRATDSTRRRKASACSSVGGREGERNRGKVSEQKVAFTT